MKQTKTKLEWEYLKTWVGIFQVRIFQMRVSFPDTVVKQLFGMFMKLRKIRNR